MVFELFFNYMTVQPKNSQHRTNKMIWLALYNHILQIADTFLNGFTNEDRF